jgi:hypothetical protein
MDRAARAQRISGPGSSRSDRRYEQWPGDEALKLDLSKRRAEAVKQVLVAPFQIDGARLTTDGLGSKPLGPNYTPQRRAQNRRVEFVKEVTARVHRLSFTSPVRLAEGPNRRFQFGST